MTDLPEDDEYERRFAGVEKNLWRWELFVTTNTAMWWWSALAASGSWAVEALARTGIAELTLIDMDVVAASNINRQLPAMSSTLGREKIEVMAERCYSINPRIKINVVDRLI